MTNLKEIDLAREEIEQHIIVSYERNYTLLGFIKSALWFARRMNLLQKHLTLRVVFTVPNVISVPAVDAQKFCFVFWLPIAIHEAS